MKTFFYLAVIGAAAYAYAHYAPAGTADRALDKVGLANFFNESVPSYLRNKLSIPESPVTKRKKLMSELASAIGGIESEIFSVAPEESNGRASPKLPKEISQRLSEAQKLVEQSQDVLAELEKANQGQGVFQKAAERLLDKILPPVPTTGVPGARVCEPAQK